MNDRAYFLHPWFVTHDLCQNFLMEIKIPIKMQNNVILKFYKLSKIS